VNEIVLRVNGRRYGGWKTASVTRGIEHLAGTFELSVSERWANQDQPWPIDEGDECAVDVAGQTVITGYVSRCRPSFTATDHAISITGRDKTGDLADCSAFLDKWEFSKIDLVKFAEKLCKPHGIKVSLQPGLTLPGQSITIAKKFHVSPGDTAFSVLEHACRLAGLLPVAGDDGELLLTRAGAERAADELVQGKNCLAADMEFDSTNRFAEYVVLGQHATAEDFFGESASTIKASATDPNVKRSARKLIVRPEGGVTQAAAKARAQWEATTRAARSASGSVTVQGWRQSNGDLWPVNALVKVRAPWVRVNGNMLITQATYSIGPDGELTTLTLKRPDAFKPEPSVSRDGLWKEISRGV
jgi:prophage tail gpP-like protein